MSWKYKQFHQQRLFPAAREEVFDRARAVMAESVGWAITKETSEGFTAEGSSFGHVGIANFQIRSTAGGISVTVELLVERAGFTGFMLFDVGGYYNIQIRKWLNAIQSAVHQEATTQRNTIAPPPLVPPNKTAARVFHGCLLLIVLSFGLYFLIIFVAAAIGLITGNLLMIGRSGTLHVHGIWARVVSAAILGAGAWIVWRIMKGRPSRPVLP
jgi:hypothetical protein